MRNVKTICGSAKLAIPTLFLLASTAHAADPQGSLPRITDRVSSAFESAHFYAGLRGGVSVADETSFDVTGATIVNSFESASPMANIFAGYELRLGPAGSARVEVEAGYGSYNIKEHLIASAPQFASRGSTIVNTGAVNAYIDAHWGAVRPFVGAGFGIAIVDFDDHGTLVAGTVMDSSDASFLWQVAGGIGFDVSSNFVVETMVRYQSIMDVELTSTTLGGNLTSSTELNSIQGLVGLRYNF